MEVASRTSDLRSTPRPPLVDTHLMQPEHPRNTPQSSNKRFIDIVTSSPHALPTGKTVSPVAPFQLTGAAALAEQHRHNERMCKVTPSTSPNPAAEALRALAGQTDTSKPSDAPSFTRATPLPQYATSRVESLVKTPVSATFSESARSSFRGSDSGIPAGSSVGHGPTTTRLAEEPEVMTADDRARFNLGRPRGSFDHRGDSRPSSYPGPLTGHMAVDRRDMSMPGQVMGETPDRAAKRHKCPYCTTDFTRHHNLKSHLLTHSQEKPYVCQTCPLRFRRLHDLKRHAKLHTGERPHLCSSCGRRFARGDALARHTKGPTGCTGRRTSLGGDDDSGDADGDGYDAMDGLEHEGDSRDGADDDGSAGSSAAARRGSEPSRKRAYHDSGEKRKHGPSTYPPHNRPYEPSHVRVVPAHLNLSKHDNYNADKSLPSPNVIPAYQPQYSTSYSQGSMTQSPAPLSPGRIEAVQPKSSTSEASALRGRSHSLTQQFQQQQYGRNSERANQLPRHATQLPPGHSTGIGAHSTTTSVYAPSPVAATVAVQNPSRPVEVTGATPVTYHDNASANSLSGGSSRELFGQDPQEMWAYIRHLDQRFSRMQDEYELRISRLQEEVIALKQTVYQR